jgi:single-strand DNA-binding protein
MYQTITIIGRAGRDPELKYTAGGDPVCSFSLATDRSWTGKDGQKQTETTWFRVSVFGKQAEIVNQYLRKGRLALVEGRLVVDAATGGPRVYQGKDGVHKSSLEIAANTVRFLSSPAEEQATPAAAPQPPAKPAAKRPAGGSDDDVPF